MNEFSSLGYWVRRYRKALDLTQTDLARQVFCSLSTIKKIELDERRPSRLMAERLAQCLQIEGSDRKTFLAIASSQLTADRLILPVSPMIPYPSHSNLASFQPLTPFVGYKEELSEISKLINKYGCRLISLVGPGGIGKTRLALQAAAEQLANFTDGVYFIPLAQLENPNYIPAAIMDALSLPKHDVLDMRAYLLEYLHDKDLLLVLDNFENLLDGVDFIIDLIRSDPTVVLLTTSITPLNLRMERVFRVNGMSIKLLEGTANPEMNDAVELFLQIARQVGAQIELNRENLDRIIQICKLVNGMPLAIELAAAWARTRSFIEIEAGIRSGLEFLSSSMRDIPERHRSIRAVFEFSWYFLSEEEKRVFPILSIFHGGFHQHAIETIAGAQEATLESLVTKSLLRRDVSDRYNMHELLRRYSELKLNELEKVKHYRNLHLSYYLNLAENSFIDAQLTPDLVCYPSLMDEIDNFRAALTTALDNSFQEHSLRLAIALGPFWHENGHLSEGMAWLNKVLQLENGDFPALRAQALIQSAMIAQNLGDFEQAILMSKESLSLCKALNDKPGIAHSLMNLGIVYYLNGEFENGRKLLKKSLDIFIETGDEKYQAQALIRIADSNMRMGMLDQAGEQWKQALLISSKRNHKKEMGFSLGGLGDVRRLQGKYAEAFELFRKSLQIHWEENHMLDLPYVMEALAMDYVPLGMMEQAVNLWGAAETLRNEINSPLPPAYQKSYDIVIAEARMYLGESEFLNAWQAGRSASLEQVINNLLNPTNDQ